ncbi:MAG TPA: family 16 glycoside hydrolase, partial [Gemmataceae bacterium]|jgi:hypothetical protein
VAAGLALVGVLLSAGGVFRVKTPHGTIVLTVNEPGAEVTVDGNTVKVTGAGGVPVEITARPGQTLQVTKGGFTAFTKELTLAPGTQEELEVKLVPLAAAPAAAAARQVPEGPARVAGVGRGSWVIDGQDLFQRAPGGHADIRFGSREWTDYDFSYEVELISGKGVASAVFRGRDPLGQVYFLHLGAESSDVSIAHNSGGRHEDLLTRKVARAPLRPGRWHKVRVRVRGEECRCSFDDEELLHGRVVTAAAGRVGLHTIDVRCRFRNFRVTAPDGAVLWDGLPTLPADLKPVPELPPAAGFVSLFNGNDTTGWKSQPNTPGGWRVKDGVLTGIGPNGPSLLYSDREYGDFHLRAVTRINGGGNGGIGVRSTFGPVRGDKGPFPACYEAKMDVTGADADHKTGTLYATGKGAVASVRTSPVGANEWFTLEVIAVGGEVEVRVNGKRTAAYSDPRPRFRRGHVVLHRYDAASVVEFRAVEIKDLSAAAAAPVPAAPPAADGFVALFNGKDLTGWEPSPGGQANWRVVDGALVAGREGFDPKERCYLMTARGDYADYQLRVEARLSATADSGVFLRLQPFTAAGVTGHEQGYEVQLNCEARGNNQTGGVFVRPPAGDPLVAHREERTLAAANEWLTLEVTARGGRITTRVNGVPAADYTDPAPHLARGHIGVQYTRGLVQVRRIEVRELPPAAAPADGFVPLFNGKDLTGWEPYPGGAARWSVEGGELVGRGGRGLLFSKRGDYADVHVRVEAKVTPSGNSGVFFRMPYSNDSKTGYEAQIYAGDKGDSKTGSLYGVVRTAAAVPPANEWFTLEVIARGPRIQILVNGQTAVDYTDPAPRSRVGYLALQQQTAEGEVRFRKVEVKELR